MSGKPSNALALRFVGGVVGRAALAMAGSALVLTLLPLLLGWKPFVVNSGSMEPRIGVGDVVLASPNHVRSVLLGHVTVFADPAARGEYKSHRVVAVEPDGRLRTKGDANPTPDPAPVPLKDVVGLGRLLVPGVGLPLVWLRTGRVLPLGLLVLGLFGASWAIARDHEPDEERHPRVVFLSVVGAVVVGGLVVPGASAAFSSTTRTTASSWAVSSQRYSSAVNALTPYLFWPLSETGTSPATAADASGNGRTGVYVGGVTTGVTGGTSDDTTNRAVTLTNAFSCVNTSSLTAISAPTTFSEVVCFTEATTNTLGGKLIGFENPQLGIGIAGVTSTYDRQIYLDGAGKLWFGVYNSALSGSAAYVGLSSTATYNDGAWHMAAATIGPSGMALYVDGKRLATSTNTVAQTATGYWRVGCGNLQGWGSNWTGANNPDQNLVNLVYNAVFNGSVADAAVFSGQALSATQVAQLYFAR